MSKPRTETERQVVANKEAKSGEATKYLSRAILLQSEKPDVFEELSDNPEFIQKVQVALSRLSTEKLLEITSENPEFQVFLIQIPFIQTENVLYRTNSIRKNPEANWSDKIMSLVGGLDGTDILTQVTNHLGDPVRTKKDKHHKTAERAELISEHVGYLEGNSDVSIDTLMSEVSDVIYNLVQLLYLDPAEEMRDVYQAYLEKICEIYEVPYSSILSLVMAKYHHRMFVSKNGANSYGSEDHLILSVIHEYFPELLGDFRNTRTKINKSFKFFDKLFVDLHSMLVNKFYEQFEDLDEKSQQILIDNITRALGNYSKLLEIPGIDAQITQLMSRSADETVSKRIIRELDED